ncbi:hypothetical protein MMC11_005754 [Xylographa trunciseda]|nr:hypothetical protein [Xylographa trunciseda]
MQHYSEDPYEFTIIKDAKIEAAQFIFKIFLELSERRTKDFMYKHPSKNLLRCLAKRPKRIVTTHLKFVAALLTGTGRAEVVWLIELKDRPTTSSDQLQLVEEIWPTIQKANEVAQAQAQVEMSRILFTSQDKPMLRAGKGTVKRQPTVQAYREEFNAMYEVVE